MLILIWCALSFSDAFTAHFWRCLWELLGSRVALSSYHPQMDGQTKHSLDSGIGYLLCFGLAWVP